MMARGACSRHSELKLARWAARRFDADVARQTTMCTSCQPCPMCTGAIARSGLGRVVFALSGEQLQELKPAAAVSPDAADVAYEGPVLFAAIGSMALPVPTLGGAMKFRATLVLDLAAPSIAEAGEKLNELVEHAKRNSEMDVQDVQLGTAPKSEPVTLPTPMPRPERGSTPPPPAPPQPPYASPTTPRSPRAAEHGDFHHRR
jgi:hypothetical protein